MPKQFRFRICFLKICPALVKNPVKDANQNLIPSFLPLNPLGSERNPLGEKGTFSQNHQGLGQLAEAWWHLFRHSERGAGMPKRSTTWVNVNVVLVVLLHLLLLLFQFHHHHHHHLCCCWLLWWWWEWWWLTYFQPVTLFRSLNSGCF